MGDVRRLRNGNIIESIPLDVNVRSYTFTNVTTDERYVVGGITPDLKEFDVSVEVKFKSRMYYGTSDSPNPSDAIVTNWSSILVDKDTDLGRRIFDCENGDYIYFAVPDDLHLTYDFFSNGMKDGNWVYEVRNLTNQYGYVKPYRIYHTGKTRMSHFASYTNIISMIVPTNHADTYATHDSFYGKGGWREVNTLDERNAIPEERRRIGMVVYVRETFKAYLLKNSLSNAGWVPFNIDDEEYVTEDEMNTAIVDALENYNTKAEIQDILGGYATKQWVIDYIGDIDLADYQKKVDNNLQTENKSIVGAINELLAGKANVGDSYTKGEVDDIIENLPIPRDVYSKEEVNTLLEAKANTSDVTSIENRVEAIEQGDLFVLTEEYEAKCAQYEADIAALQQENAELQTTVNTLKSTLVAAQVKLDYVYNVVTTPHYDILPDEEP